jgi:ABC-2 type transport system ATP-binding protein
MIRFEDVSKSFKGTRALAGVSLDVSAGAVIVVAGPDGAGKSTLLKAAVGLVRIDTGRILFRGRPVRPGFEEVRRAAGYMPEKSALYPDLTAAETLRFVAAIYGLSRVRSLSTVERLLDWSALAPFAGRRTAALSGGMRQKLALCAALVPDPGVLVLDEPATGLDPLMRIEVGRLIAGLRSEGKAILMSVSDLDDAGPADTVLRLEAGRVVGRGGAS